MHIHHLVILIALAFTFSACQKVSLDELTDIHWRLEQMTDANTGEVHIFPTDLEAYGIVFSPDGTIAFTNACNYHDGKYTILSRNRIRFSELGPGTYAWCNELSEWELGLIHIFENICNLHTTATHLTLSYKQINYRFERALLDTQ